MHTYTEDDVRERAYLLWIEAGSPDGRDVEFWFIAQRELAEKHNLHQSELSGRSIHGDVSNGLSER